MGNANAAVGQTTAGIDIGDKHSEVCVIDGGGNVAERSRFATTPAGLKKAFRRRPRMRVVIEVGTHSAWMCDHLEELGHEVFVANARELERITKSDRKNDRNDAELLARIGRLDPSLLSPIRHRSREHRCDLAQIRAREALVKTRTQLINNARGLAKSYGARLPKCSAESFHKRAAQVLPRALAPVLAPTLAILEQVTKEIRASQRRIERLAAEKYRETRLLMQVSGIGALTALTFVLTIGDPKRFPKSRVVGSYFGLVPRQQQSSGADPQLRITKSGDGLVRKLLVGSAHYILGPFGPDTDLRRWGKALAARGGKSAKKRAVVAVARKLAVLLHRLWMTGEVYEPLRNTTRVTVKAS